MISLSATLFLERYQRDFALLFSVVSGAVIFVNILGEYVGIIGYFEGLINKAGLSNDILSIGLKSTGICYLTSFASDLCRDYGHTSLASNVELAGRFSVLIIVLPLLTNIFNTALELAG